MRHPVRPSVLASALTIVASCALSDPGYAVDMTGRMGLGALIDTNFGQGVSGRYWVSNLGLEVLLGFDAEELEDEDTSSRAVEVRLGGRVLYALTRTRDVNLDVGVGLSTEFLHGPQGTSNPLFVDFILSPSFYMSRHFAVGGLVSLTIELASDPGRQFTSGSWGASFHYYF